MRNHTLTVARGLGKYSIPLLHQFEVEELKRTATDQVTGQVGKRTPKRTPNGLEKIGSDKTVYA